MPYKSRHNGDTTLKYPKCVIKLFVRHQNERNNYFFEAFHWKKIPGSNFPVSCRLFSCRLGARNSIDCDGYSCAGTHAECSTCLTKRRCLFPIHVRMSAKSVLSSHQAKEKSHATMVRLNFSFFETTLLIFMFILPKRFPFWGLRPSF